MDLQFGQYRLKRSERQLLGPKGFVELSARSFDILALLLGKPDEVVGKNELFDAVWPGQIVEENTLQVHMSALRKTLDAGMITTVHGRGYKYAGPRPVAPAAEISVPPKPSIAVLPFTNLSGDTAQDIFCEGLSLNIVTSLGRYHELFVIDRFSTLAYRNRPVTPAAAALEFSVRYILEGSVQKAGDRIRVSVRLVDGTENRQLWTETYDRQLTDIFAVQDEITGMIIGTLASGYGGRLGKAWRDRNKSAGLDSFVALDHLQRAIDACRFTKEGEIIAREHLTRAIECDPGLAKAYSKMSLGHTVDACCGWADDYDASMELARRWAVKAVACDDSDSWSHWAFANYHLYSLNHGAALDAFRMALDCNPNDAEVTTDYGLCLSYSGKAEEGIAQALKAMRLNPFHYEWYTSQLGQIYFDARQYDRAIATFAGLRSLDSAIMRIYQAASLAATGNQQQAGKSIQRVLELDPGATLQKWTDPKLAPYGDAACLEHFSQNLRKALDVGMIATVHGRGYKYAGPSPLENENQSVAPQPMVSARKPMLVVMPFDNLSDDPDQQFFSDGMTGDITDRLARFGAFAVIGQHSAASFRTTAPDVAAIRERLKVDFIVTGSVRRAGERIRFAVRLSDAASGEAIWGERYDRPIGDLFTLQDEISQLVAAAIARHLEVEINVRSIGRPSASLSSYEHLLQGYWHYKKFTLAGVAAAKLCFERAIASDPRNAGALGWLGVINCEYWLLDFHLESAVKGLEFTSQAIALDPTSASSHAAHNWALLCVGDLAGALHTSERGISLNPSDPNVMVHRALALGYDGRTIEAKDLISQAHRLEPMPPLWFAEFSGIVAFSEGRYEETLAGTEPVAEPAWDMMYMLACYGLMGEKLKARAVLERLAAAGRNPDWALGISREPYRDPAIRERLSEGIAKALLL